ncbi:MULTISPECIES: hypothetical protein [Brucella/Ochrobactrum group]|uniref:hypothetical protein n=1 Tax=Brucella/Ochrobactrum group TaxID=2826938 RepID=UPI00111D9141|nr:MULTISPECIES: hypothetical protein [Brucella/Ochrobactrum group]
MGELLFWIVLVGLPLLLVNGFAYAHYLKGKSIHRMTETSRVQAQPKINRAETAHTIKFALGRSWFFRIDLRQRISSSDDVFSGVPSKLWISSCELVFGS